MESKKTLLFWCLLFCGLFIYLQNEYRFLFYFEEQLQLFLFSYQYAIDTICQPGGISLYIARFFIQFFALPFAGAIIIALLLTGTGLMAQAAIARVTGGKCQALLLYVLPVTGLLAGQLDFNYSLQGTVSYLLMLAAWNGYIRIPALAYRLGTGWILLPVLYWIAGQWLLCLYLW